MAIGLHLSEAAAAAATFSHPSRDCPGLGMPSRHRIACRAQEQQQSYPWSSCPEPRCGCGRPVAGHEVAPTGDRGTALNLIEIVPWEGQSLSRQSTVRATRASECARRYQPRLQRKWCPWRDSNPRTWLRRPVLYPLSYRGLSDRNGQPQSPDASLHAHWPADANIPARHSRKQLPPALIACPSRPWRTTVPVLAAPSAWSQPSS